MFDFRFDRAAKTMLRLYADAGDTEEVGHEETFVPLHSPERTGIKRLITSASLTGGRVGDGAAQWLKKTIRRLEQQKSNPTLIAPKFMCGQGALNGMTAERKRKGAMLSAYANPDCKKRFSHS
jgi:hypothetical protein